MSEKPISPLHQRTLEDMSLRGFTPDTQRDYIRAVKTLAAFFGPISRHCDCRRPARLPAAPDRDQRSTANHQRDGGGAAVLLQGDTRPAGDDTTSRIRLRAAQAAARSLARGVL